VATKTRKKSASKKATVDRRDPQSGDRRQGERRTKNAPVAKERRTLQRREKVNRRRQIDPTTCERDYSVEEVEFMQALDDYKRKSGRMFPTCSEMLEVIRDLGYVKQTADAQTPAADSAALDETPADATVAPSETANEAQAESSETNQGGAIS